MANEKGVIEEVVGHRATVRVMKTGACAGCTEKDGCQMRMGGDKPTLVNVDNDLEARAGDWVELSMPTRNLLKVSFLVYVLPMLAFVAAAAMGAEWGHLLNLSPDFASITFGGAVLLISFVLLRRVDRTIRRRGEYYPRMKKIIPPEPC